MYIPMCRGPHLDTPPIHRFLGYRGLRNGKEKKTDVPLLRGSSPGSSGSSSSPSWEDSASSPVLGMALIQNMDSVGVPTFHGRNNEYQQWTIVYNSIRQRIGMRKNRDRGMSGVGPVPVRPGSVSTGIDPMRRGPASLEGPPSLLCQRPKRSLQGLYRD